jgi:hypothetical protein
MITDLQLASHEKNHSEKLQSNKIHIKYLLYHMIYICSIEGLPILSKNKKHITCVFWLASTKVFPTLGVSAETKVRKGLVYEGMQRSERKQNPSASKKNVESKQMQSQLSGASLTYIQIHMCTHTDTHTHTPTQRNN